MSRRLRITHSIITPPAPPARSARRIAQRIVAACHIGSITPHSRSHLGRPPSSPPSRRPPPPWRRPRGSAAGRSGQRPCAPVRGQQRGSLPRHATHACAALAHAGPGATLWDRVSVPDPHLHALQLRVQRVYRSLHRLERRLVVRRVHLHRAGSVSPQARASNRIDCGRGLAASVRICPRTAPPPYPAPWLRCRPSPPPSASTRSAARSTWPPPVRLSATQRDTEWSRRARRNPQQKPGRAPSPPAGRAGRRRRTGPAARGGSPRPAPPGVR